MGEKIELQGFYEPKFEKVKDAFLLNFEDRWECGASYALNINGKFVIDIWGGYADKDHTKLWQKDTICNVYSTTKVMCVISTLICVDRGLLDIEAPVKDYWPEFAANGKEKLPVKNLFSHSSGLAGLEEVIKPEVYYDWDKTVALLAAQKPWWEPGKKSGYHAITHGYLLGELVRKVTGKSLGTFFKEEVADKLNADFHIGLTKQHIPRVSDLFPGKLIVDFFPIIIKAIFNMANKSEAVQNEIGDWTKTIQIDVKGYKKFVLKTHDKKFHIEEGEIENPEISLYIPSGNPSMIYLLFPHHSESQEFVDQNLKISGKTEDIEKLKRIFYHIIYDARKSAGVGLKMLLNPISLSPNVNTWEWRSAEIPAANGHGNARSVARAASVISNGGTVDGIRFMSRETVDKALEEQIYDRDLIMQVPTRFGLGVGLTSKEKPFPSTVCYWGGAGGSSIIMDVDNKMTSAYVMNQMRNQKPDETIQNKYASDTRANRIVTAVYESLGLI